MVFSLLSQKAAEEGLGHIHIVGAGTGGGPCYQQRANQGAQPDAVGTFVQYPADQSHHWDSEIEMIGVHEITEEGKFICKDLDELKETMPSTYNFKKSIDVDSFCDIAIHNKEGNTIGFIAIHWFNKENMKVDKDTINQLVWYAEEHLINSK